MTDYGHGRILSIDLACRRYEDNGIVCLDPSNPRPEVLKPSDLGLRGKPKVIDFAAALTRFSNREGVAVTLIDGPQGWRHPGSQVEHMRLCERALNTPGKTGNVGSVKPANYLPYIRFSIDLFRTLHLDHGWPLLTADWIERPGRRWLVESFPSSTWQALGLKRLPGKARTTATQLKSWSRDLCTITGLELPDDLSHDELQATVVLPIGLAIADGNPEGVLLSGTDPVIGDDGEILEGWIANPRPRGERRKRHVG